MNNDEAANFLNPFFLMGEQELLAKFAALKDAILIKCKGDKNLNCVLIPGTREDKALIVAHVDTVNNNAQIKPPYYENGFFMSGNLYKGVNKKGQAYVSGAPFGADDRAGVGMMWLLKEMGHSILLTNSEELGCLGSMFLMSNDTLAEMINDHQFMIQLDRKGHNDLVFYDVGTPEFIKYCEKSTGYKEKEGTCTDICVLCDDICGVNISVGYKNEHCATETLNMRWWLKTYNTVKNWLSSPNLPKFEL